MRPGPRRLPLPRVAGATASGDEMVGPARNRLRTEFELREAEALVARSHGLSLDESAQALRDAARLMRTPLVGVARAVISGRAIVSRTRRNIGATPSRRERPECAPEMPG
jgi:hypothetical protein